MAAFSLTMGKLIAVMVIAILASSAIAVGASTMLAVGPAGRRVSKGKRAKQEQLAPQAKMAQMVETATTELQDQTCYSTVPVEVHVAFRTVLVWLS